MFKTFKPNTTSCHCHIRELTTNCANVNNASWKARVPLLKNHDLFHFQLVRLSLDLGCLPSSAPYSGQNDLVEVRLRQLSYHIGPTPVSSGPSSALLAPDCTKNAGIISFFEPPSATTLTKGLLLILDHLFASPHPCPLIQTPTGPSPLSHLPLTSTLQTQNLGSQGGARLNSMKQTGNIRVLSQTLSGEGQWFCSNGQRSSFALSLIYHFKRKSLTPSTKPTFRHT